MGVVSGPCRGPPLPWTARVPMPRRGRPPPSFSALTARPPADAAPPLAAGVSGTAPTTGSTKRRYASRYPSSTRSEVVAAHFGRGILRSVQVQRREHALVRADHVEVDRAIDAAGRRVLPAAAAVVRAMAERLDQAVEALGRAQVHLDGLALEVASTPSARARAPRRRGRGRASSGAAVTKRICSAPAAIASERPEPPASPDSVSRWLSPAKMPPFGNDDAPHGHDRRARGGRS